MKKTTSVITTIFVLIAAFSLIVAANAGYVSTKPKSEKKIVTVDNLSQFSANITVHVYEGEGCECVPLRDIPINATGRDTDNYTSGHTDNNGTCVLQLELEKTYRVSIQAGDHESVLFDFVVIGDQPFSFNLKKTAGSSAHVLPQLSTLLYRIQAITKLIKKTL